jgi:hypothetical protein
MNHKSPDLNIRYATGLGDFIASILHSKSLSWLIKIITKKDKPCDSCSQRRFALNVLFPIRFWKIFFKNNKEYLQSLKNFYIKCGYNASFSEDENYLKISRFEEEPIEQPEEQATQFLTNVALKNRKEGYLFLSDNEVTLGEHLIKTEYYKKL